MTACSTILLKLIETNVNTKTAIKDKIRTLARHIKNANNLVATCEHATTSKTPGSQVSLTQHKTADTQARDRETRTVGTQTVETTVESEQDKTRRENQMKAEDIRNKLQTIKNAEEIETLLDQVWPECTFLKVDVEVGNPLRSDAEGDLAVFVEDPTMSKGISRLFRERYPELTEVNSLDEHHEGTTYITSMIKVPEGKTFKVREKYIFKVALMVTAEESDRSEAVVDAAKKLRDLAQECGRSRIRVPIPDNHSAEVTRKVLEYVFANTDMNVTLHVPRNKDTIAERETRPENPVKPARTNRDTETIIVKSDERSYAELLKEVKEQVDMNQFGVEVKKVKKTRRGELLLTIKGGEGKANPVKEAIASKLKDAQVKSPKLPETQFQVYGIDATTTPQEVKDAIAKAIGEENEKVAVKSLRPTTNDEQVATVAINRSGDQKLKAVRSVKIGWNYCRVREWVQIPRCHNCQSYGHLAETCKGPNRSSCCWNCGEEGHTASECKNEKCCLTCGTKGHKSGTRQCAIFKKLLEKNKGKKPGGPKWQ